MWRAAGHRSRCTFFRGGFFFLGLATAACFQDRHDNKEEPDREMPDRKREKDMKGGSDRKGDRPPMIRIGGWLIPSTWKEGPAVSGSAFANQF